jgi:3-keto-disaccharide hydrolase
MKRLLSLAATLLLALPAFAEDTPKAEAPVVKPRTGKSETIKLFDGKTLDGWEGHEKLWSVKDGAIVGKNTEEVKVSTYLVTKRKFSDFLLKGRVKLVDGGPTAMHSGITLWGHLAPEKGDKYTYMGHLVMFPSGWGMYDLHRRNGLPVDGGPARKVGKQKDWNDLWILAQGNRVRVAVNGTLVADWRDPKPELIEEGVIGLQLHANKVPQEVRFKDLVITTFPDDKGWDVKVGEKLKTEK